MLPAWDRITNSETWKNLSIEQKRKVYNGYLSDLGKTDAWKGLSSEQRINLVRAMQADAGPEFITEPAFQQPTSLEQGFLSLSEGIMGTEPARPKPVIPPPRPPGIYQAPAERGLLEKAVQKLSGLLRRPSPLATEKGISEEAKAQALVELMAKEEGVPLSEYREAPGAIEQFAQGFTDVASFGLLPALERAFGGKEPIPPTSVKEKFGSGLGSFAGLLFGPTKGMEKITHPIVKRLPKLTAGENAAIRLLKQGIKETIGLAPVIGVAETGRALEKRTFREAAGDILNATKGGALTGAIFGMTRGLFPKEVQQRAQRIVTGWLTLNAQRILEDPRHKGPWDRPVEDVIYDTVMDTYFMWRGLPREQFDALADKIEGGEIELPPSKEIPPKPIPTRARGEEKAIEPTTLLETEEIAPPKPPIATLKEPIPPKPIPKAGQEEITPKRPPGEEISPKPIPTITRVEEEQAGKQPWQMTKQAFNGQAKMAIRDTRTGEVYPANKDERVHGTIVRRLESQGIKLENMEAGWILPSGEFSTRWTGKIPAEFNYGHDLHEYLVREALAKGKPVPQEVLQDYPDLQKQFPGIRGIESELGKEINKAIGDITMPSGSIDLAVLRKEPIPKRRESFEFSDKEIERRFKAAQEMKKDPFWERLKTTVTTLKNKMTREFEHLPKTEEFAQLRFDLLRLAKQKSVASDRALRAIQGVTINLSKEDYNLFTRKVILDDLAEVASEEKKLPFGFDQEKLNKEVSRLDKAIHGKKVIREALDKRKTFWEALNVLGGIEKRLHRGNEDDRF